MTAYTPSIAAAAARMGVHSEADLARLAMRRRLGWLRYELVKRRATVDDVLELKRDWMRRQA